MDAVSFASHERSKEELIAEFGAAYLCGSCGIAPKTLENSAAYIAYWAATLRQDKTLLMQAASHAQRAVDFILHVSVSQEPESETTA
jgi:antirestriction protein ArdC